MGDNTPDGKTFSTDGTRMFDATTDDPAHDDETDVLLSGIPIIGEAHPLRPWLRCNGRQVNQKSPIWWEVTATYLAAVAGSQSPMDLAPKIAWRSIASDEEIDQDQDGNPICTCLGEPFEPKVRVTKRDRVLTIRRFLSDFDPNLITSYTDAVNSDPVLEVPIGTAKINVLDAESVTDQTNGTYWDAQIEIQFRRGAPNTTDAHAWWRRVMAQGYYVRFTLPGGITGIHRATEGLGQYSARPVPHYNRVTRGLLESPPGTWIDWTFQPGDEILPGQDGNPGRLPFAQWYEFRVFPSMPYSVLGFI
jgi:hypothetical protein